MYKINSFFNYTQLIYDRKCDISKVFFAFDGMIAMGSIVLFETQRK